MNFQAIWDTVKRISVEVWNWTLRYPVALVISVGVVLIAVILMLLGVGNRFNLGGILGLLFGKKPENKTPTIEIVNNVPEARVDSKGKTIPIGTPDENGYVQREVNVIDQTRNPFRDKSVIVVDEETFQLPKGMLDTDVKTVIQVEPEVYKIVVTNRPKHKVSSNDLNYLSILTFICLLAMPSISSAVVCPEGYKCVPNGVAAEWKEILTHQQCMDNALDGLNDELKVKFEPYTVIVSQDGQVFDNDVLEVLVKWCDYELLLAAKPNLRVMTKAQSAEPEWGFRLRIKLGAAIDLSELFPVQIEPVLLLEPLYYKYLHVGMYISMKSVGMLVGLDLTKNADIFVGVGANWDTTISAKLGISLSFN